MGDVARAMQGQGFVVDVIELLADESEDAAGRSAAAQSIGGDFVHQLMQVSFVSDAANAFDESSSHRSWQHFATEPSTFKALISSFSVLQASDLDSKQ
jgi:hypothetical protein